MSLPSLPRRIPTNPSVVHTPPDEKPLGPILPTSTIPSGVEVVESYRMQYSLDELLNQMLDMEASDLHLSPGVPPMIRVHGIMDPLPGHSKLNSIQVEALAYSIMQQSQRNIFEDKLELDFAYELSGRSRFRINIMRQKGFLSAVIRAVPWNIRSLEDLGLPSVINRFSTLPRGLILVTGQTGSGKSTTLAAIIDKANRERKGHIVTIEDPIEFIHTHKNSVVNQREVGTDTHSYSDALRHVLRQDPNIILIGEMRDLETISVALTAAETGHLVFATLHTQSAETTISRIIDVFPENSKDNIRTQLASSIQGIISQTLVTKSKGKGRVAAVEILLGNTAIRNLIREKKEHHITNALKTGRKDGMQTLDSHLQELVKNGTVLYENALDKVIQKEQFKSDLGGEEAIRRIERERIARENTLQG